MLDKKRSLLIVTDIQGKLARLMFERDALFKKSELKKSPGQAVILQALKQLCSNYSA